MVVNAVDVNLIAQEEYLGDGLGGITRYCREQVKNLQNISPEDSRIRVTSINESGSLGMFSAKALGLSFRPSSKITHNMTERPLIPIRRSSTALVNTAHEFQRILYPEVTKVEGRLLSEMPSYWMKKSYMWDILKADYLITTSTQTRDEAVELGFDNDVFVVNLGVGDEFLGKTRHSDQKRMKFTIGYIGAVRKRKGVSTLMESMNYLDDGFRLRMYGMVFNRYREEFNSLLKASKNTKYYGTIAANRLVDTYDSFDVLVMPSMYEGFGLGILEAQARGIPVIINSKGKVPRETSRYCMKADGPEGIAKLLWHLKDKGYDEKLRSTAMKYARGFTWMRTAEETLNVYGKIM